MVDVVVLNPGEEPPDGEDWIVVAHDPSGKFFASGSAAHGRIGTFSAPYPDGEIDRDVAIEKAKR